MVLFWAGLLDIMEDPDRFFLYLFDQEIRAGLAVPINIKSVVLERRFAFSVSVRIRASLCVGVFTLTCSYKMKGAKIGVYT